MPARNTSPETPLHPRDVLAAHSLRPHKALGQNFLVSAANLDRVADAAQLGPADVVLEIGTGMGQLTERLAARAGRVVSAEIDRGLLAIASARLAGTTNVRFVCCDFLAGKHRISDEVADAVRAAGAGAAQPLKVVSNLPYGISSPAIVNLLEWDLAVGEMCLMLQKEVGDRILARPGTKEYGPLTVVVGYWATAERLGTFPRQAFWPPPEVSSTLLRIAKKPGLVRTERYDVFAAVVGRLFRSRRKALSAVVRAGWGRDVAEGLQDSTGIDPRRRAEELGVEELGTLARALGPPLRD
jgi:16S rRNA (adenine1518-N6/adenine1519-N6)-dimethyltransferase